MKNNTKKVKVCGTTRNGAGPAVDCPVSQGPCRRLKKNVPSRQAQLEAVGGQGIGSCKQRQGVEGSIEDTKMLKIYSLVFRHVSLKCKYYLGSLH